MNLMTEIAAHAVIKRSAMHVAASMIHGCYAERERAWDTAVEIEDEVTGFTELAKRSITMLGHDPAQVWVQPVEGRQAEQVDQVPYKAAFLSCRKALVDFIAFGLAAGSDERWDAANRLMSVLNAIGLDVDGPVDYVLSHHTDVGSRGRVRPSSRYPRLGEPPF